MYKLLIMQRFYMLPTSTTPEINFSPEENIFFIRGNSSPEDVRALYYPVIEWIKTFVNDLVEKKTNTFSAVNPLIMQTDLTYFNSSSAKFLYDIYVELKRLTTSGIPLVVEWYYDMEDTDMEEAGTDISMLVEMEFVYKPKER